MNSACPGRGQPIDWALLRCGGSGSILQRLHPPDAAGCNILPFQLILWWFRHYRGTTGQDDRYRRTFPQVFEAVRYWAFFFRPISRVVLSVDPGRAWPQVERCRCDLCRFYHGGARLPPYYGFHMVIRQSGTRKGLDDTKLYRFGGHALFVRGRVAVRSHRCGNILLDLLCRVDSCRLFITLPDGGVR